MDINHIAVGGVWEVGGMDVGSWDEGEDRTKGNASLKRTDGNRILRTGK